jgi:outer membrane protein insertion porin family
LTYFGGPFGGDQDLLKLEGRFEQYFELGESVSEVDPVLLIEAGVGIAAPLGRSEETHYSERWFLGGTQRLRGFDFRGVGPNEGGIALGGESMAYGSVEMRWPLFSTPIPGTSRKAEMFRGGPFVDFGVLDPNAWDFDMDELRVSYGLSFAMVRPIPISFNLGWPLLEGEGDSLEVFSFSLSLR